MTIILKIGGLNTSCRKIEIALQVISTKTLAPELEFTIYHALRTQSHFIQEGYFS